MARTSKKVVESPEQLRPVLSPEAREARLISLAMDQVEEQLLNHTASSQVLVHYLKLSTEREKREVERLENENLLLRAKTESLQSAKETEGKYAEVIELLKKYRGHNFDNNYGEEYEFDKD